MSRSRALAMKRNRSMRGKCCKQGHIRDTSCGNTGCVESFVFAFYDSNDGCSILTQGFMTKLRITTVMRVPMFRLVLFSNLSFNSVSRDVTKKEHPEAVRPLLPEIRDFAKQNHFNVLHPILRYDVKRVQFPPKWMLNVFQITCTGYGIAGGNICEHSRIQCNR